MFQDLRYGIRMLLKTPAFTFVAILSLAIGIGANTAIFSIVKSVLIEPLPFAQPDLLLQARYHDQSTGTEDDWVAHRDLVDWQERSQSFERIGAYRYAMLNFAQDSQPEAIWGLNVTYELLPALGVEPAMGRYFLQEEDQPGRNRVIILSDDLWRRRFAATPDIIGQTIRLSGEGYTVVGVMPPGFNFPLKLATDVRVPSRQMGFWTALGADGNAQSRRNTNCNAILQLKPGIRAERAQAEIDSIAAQLAHEYPETNARRGLRLISLKDQTVGDAHTALVVLLGAVGLVLLMVCANIANLLLARADGRRKEMAIRQALGANRWRLARQALTESLLLASIGGAAGVAFTAWSLKLLLKLSPQNIPRLAESRIDAGALGFALAVTALAGLLFGAFPAWRASRLNLNEGLKRSASNLSARRASLRSPGNALVTLEIALALALTLGAGLLLNSFARLMRVDPGFRAEGALAAIIVLPRTQYPDASSNIAFFRSVVERLEATPGVEAAGLSNSLPMSGHGNGAYLQIEGRERPAADDPSMISAMHLVSPNYLGALGIPLLRGRLLTAHDTADTPAIAVINETAAERFWFGEDPIGKRFRFEQADGREVWRQVVGVVRATHLRRLDELPIAEVYVPIEQTSGRADILVARSAMPQARLAAALRQAVAEVDKDQPVFLTMSMEDLLADSVARQRFSLLVLGVFSALSLLLAALGIYGVVSYGVVQQTREIGIRIALGAQSGDVLRMVVARSMQPVIIGAITGLLAAMTFSRVLASLLYGVTATDPITFAAVSLLLLMVALLACYVPARNATKVDPMTALRTE